MAAEWWESPQRAQNCSGGTEMSPPLCCSTAWGLCLVPLLLPRLCSGFSNSSRNLCQLCDPAPSDTCNILTFHVRPRSAPFTLIFNKQYSSGNSKRMDFKWGHPLRKKRPFYKFILQELKAGLEHPKGSSCAVCQKEPQEPDNACKGKKFFLKKQLQ